MNIKSKTLKNPVRADDLNTYHSGDLGLYVLRTLKAFLNSAASPDSADNIPYRRKGTSLKENVPCKANDGPSPATVATQYLLHDQSRVIQDFEDAASPSNIDSSEMRQLSALTKREEFQTWLREDSSKATKLLIHGGLDDDSSTLSALSYLCARIPMEYLRKARTGIICLHYFCSLQRARRDHPAGAFDIARSLCGQLLTHAELASAFDLSFLDEKWLRGIREEQSFVKTCQLFLRLLKQLDGRKKAMMVFCFIDSISLYETGKLRHDTERLFSSLEEYSKSQRRRQRGKRPKLIFKLLVTDAMATGYVRKYFRRKGEMIDMDEGDERDDDVDLDVLYG
ncbi:hypothetical protein F5Y00DRAFT_270714 [Daldinia vernicosa]|uniref:uncharacterized protein n=1 Tax=Daldinia vernicosa TaxID=114800 RepID=UPI00200762CE|nr:uncharacterized protein F5Y00DRAFT_270714 [Daldinia vernicosa]KAI0853566.1 hypothetical protein F5Y00DRAFT_270714 [Daldinia vernicosa]